MNTVEVVLLGITTLITGSYLWWCFRSWKTALLLTLISVTPLALSIAGVSQFLTIDEPRSLHEATQIGWAEDLKWFERFGTLRTTDFLFGTASTLIRKLLPDLPQKTLRMAVKSLHWLGGFLALLGVHYVVDRTYVDEAERPLFFTAFIVIALLFPIHAMALRTFTYDLLSMSLSVLALACIAAALHDRSRRFALAALVIAFFAAQEKPVASPILLVALALFAYLWGAEGGSHRRLRRIAFATAGIALVLALSAAEAVWIARLRQWADIDAFLRGIPEPLTAWSWPIITLTFGGEASSVSMIPLVLFAVALVFLLAELFTAAEPAIARHRARAADVLSRANTLLLVLMLGTAIALAPSTQIYHDPPIDVPAGYYEPHTEFNERVEHYEARTLVGHTLEHIRVAYVYYVADVPTALWLLFAAGLIAALATGRQWQTPPTIELLIAAAILFPLGYGALQLPHPVPASSRYMNIGLSLLAVMLLVKSVAGLTALRPALKTIITGVFCVLFVAETIPFWPVYGSFRPIWFNLDEARAQTVQNGVSDPLWGGWGEELMLVGRVIEAECQREGGGDASSDHPWASQPCEEIDVYPAFPGRWPGSKGLIELKVVGYDDLDFAPTDYYIINRTIVEIWQQRFPEGVEPVLTLDYRGFPYAWVFAGPDVKAAGIFDTP